MEIVEATEEAEAGHAVLDVLCAPGGNDRPIDIRLRALVREALGAHVARVTERDLGRRLARYNAGLAGPLAELHKAQKAFDSGEFDSIAWLHRAVRALVKSSHAFEEACSCGVCRDTVRLM